jgi:hypothetical protein
MTPQCLDGWASVMDGTPDDIGAGVYFVLLVVEVIIDMAIVQGIHDKIAFNGGSINRQKAGC